MFSAAPRLHTGGMDDEAFLREAIRLARRSVAEGGGPFGSVVVRGGKVIATGTNRVVEDADPTAHAEVTAIREACAALGTHDLSDCTIYASCEPCPMCFGAIHWARIARHVYGAGRADAAGVGFDDDRLYRQLLLPADRRLVPGVQMLRDEALVPLVEWESKPDKRVY